MALERKSARKMQEIIEKMAFMGDVFLSGFGGEDFRHRDAAVPQYTHYLYIPFQPAPVFIEFYHIITADFPC